MVILGLTGSIGMGKSTTAGFFAEAGAPVHDADAAVPRLYAGAAAAAIEAAFPGTVAGHKVDRARLGEQVIDDPAALKRLEAIVHPLVRRAAERFLQAAEDAGATIAVLNIPLLFETGGETPRAAVAAVSAPPETPRPRGMTQPRVTAKMLPRPPRT